MVSDGYRYLYSDARRYDLVSGAYATGDFLDFYRRQINRYGEPVLELACGTGRLTIPLAQTGVNIMGLDISEEMLDLAKIKAAECGVNVTFVHADVRHFSLGKKFRLIFIPAQSLAHLHERAEIEDCFACVRKHLAEGGRFLIELFNSSVKLLARESGCRFPVREYQEVNSGRRSALSEETRYDAATQINHIRWFFRDEGSDEEVAVWFAMRHFFPQEIDALIWYNGFVIEHKYGGYAEEEFTSESLKQLIVCCPG